MMVDFPLLRFVDSPAPDAVVRLDLNPSGGFYPSEFDPGFPTLEGDPDAVGVEFGHRTLEWTQVVRDSKSAAARAMSALARELGRRENWLLFQLSASSAPVWFKTYRSQPGELSLEHVYNDEGDADTWEIGVSLAAESHTYGERVTLPTVTVNNDPAAGTNPTVAVLPEILGDAPAPATVRLGWSANRHGYRHLLASTPVTHAAPIVWQVGTGDGFTAGTDTGAGTADAAYSGGSYRSVSFATDASLVTRLSGVAPVEVAPCRYKVLVRVARSDTSSTFAVRLGSKVVFSHAWGDTKTLTWGASAAAGHAAWIDLGVFSYPAGVSEISDDEPAVAPEIAFQAQRLSGTGSLRVDAFRLIPVGDDGSRVLTVNNDVVGPTASGGTALIYEVHDGDAERVYQRGAVSGKLVAMYQPILSGGFPLLHPGRDNTLHLLSQTSPSKGAGISGDVPDSITSSAEVVVSYHPRWLYLAGE